MINSTVCITEYNHKIISWLDVNSHMEQLAITDLNADIINNIYVGVVKHIAKNINACFVEFMPGVLGFLSFNDLCSDIRLVEGANIPVQVIKEASKNKEAVLTTRISLQGTYSIVECGESCVNISRKITGDNRARLRELVPSNINKSIIIRTKAADLDDTTVLIEEIKILSDKLDNILNICKMREGKKLIYSSDKEYLKFIKGLPTSTYEGIITDIPEVCDELKEYKCEFYNDNYPLSKLYSLETKINELLAKQIWLKCGGNIVIETTEAMTVIDVNSAKNSSNKSNSENTLAVNKDATKEICRQLRLRNLSGIIIVDYINMSDDEAYKDLIDYLKKMLLLDSVRCDFVDVTKLGLVELVRKKIKPPIIEKLRD